MHGNDFAMWLILSAGGWALLGASFIFMIVCAYYLYKVLRNKK